MLAGSAGMDIGTASSSPFLELKPDSRSRKIKCITVGVGDKCERCITRKLICSNVLHGTGGPLDPLLARKWPSSSTVADSPRVNTFGPSQMLSNSYDLGTETPAELLRESELVNELVRLYFDNFSDIHFMFDRESFLHGIPHGEAPKLVLYSMMALGIRYHTIKLECHKQRSHMGESLYQQARKLLKDEFDFPCLTSIHGYVLLSTYHLTFGGARKAWLYLAAASSMIKVLRLVEDPAGSDFFGREMCRRLLSTVLVMDRTLSPSLNNTCNFDIAQEFPIIASEEVLSSLKSDRFIESSLLPSPSLISELLVLSQLFCKVCIFHRRSGTNEEWQGLQQELSSWRSILYQGFIYSQENFRLHQNKQSLRQFLYLNLLYHHIGQLIFFPSLQASRLSNNTNSNTSQVIECYNHATEITEIVSYTYSTAEFDIHNVSMGQIMNVAAAVHMHGCLTANSHQQLEMYQRRIAVLIQSMTRIKSHCRVFDRILSQLETFFEICNRSSTSSNVFDKNERLIRHILHFGTSYERLKRNGRMTALEDATISPPNGPSTGIEATALYSNDSDVNLASESVDWFGNGQQSGIPDGTAWDNCAWMFSDASLTDLNSMPFFDPLVAI